MKPLLDKAKNVLKDKKKLGIIGGILILLLVILIAPSFAALTPVKSVTIESEKLSFQNNDPGAFKITKSAEWISKGKARITLTVNSIIKPKNEYNEYTDVILVLDTSGSMNENRLGTVKSQTTSLINEMISKGNKMALITFSDDSTILSDFTTDLNLLNENINNLTAVGNTNYYQALLNVESILKNYTHEENRDCVVLFLTDGLPNVDTPNEVAQYQNLKINYPYLTINGIQYEMGSSSLEGLKKVTDNQFIANTSNLNKFLYRAAVDPISYENFQITDYIDTDYFKFSSIKTNFGTTSIDGNKVTWNLDKVKSGIEVVATIDITLKDELIGVGGIYPTNEKLEVTSKIGESQENVTSKLTPILADNYQIIYEGNDPEGCTVKNVPSPKKASVFDTILITEEKPSCEGYQFKGWELVTEGVSKVNESYFIMPESDVTIRATWSKLYLAKSTEGTVSKIQTLYQMMADNSVPDNIKSEFVYSNTGINFGSISSNTNGKGIYQAVKLEGENTPIYYYRGDVKNNNVIFADHCWKIVRTTATKGVKLIYNGKIKETYSSINTIGESEYINVSNDATYPYSYDSSSNKWISTNKTHSKTGTISFSVSTEGTYVLAYAVSSEANYDKAYFYKDGVELGVYSGTASGTISLGNLTSSNIIMVKYIKDGSGSSGSDEVSFSLGKAIGDVIRSCDNTGTASQIGTRAFNSSYDSIAYNGYMYGDVYPVSANGRGDIVGLGGKREYLKSSASTTNYIYSSSVTYDEATGLYTLVDGENRVWNDTYSVGSGNQYLYTCLSETENTCSTVNYVTRSDSSSYIYYVSLTGGEVAEDTLNKEILYGNDVTYDSATGMYTLVDTISSKIGNWGADRTTIGNGHHYTCLSETGTCATVTYINYLSSVSTRSYGSFYYTTFSNGIKVEEAVKKMTTESAHTTSSTIKTTIDTWYQNNMTGYTEKLEDTTWCNDRTVNTYGPWSKDGNAVSSYSLNYKTQSESSTPKLTCRNKRDAYTVNDKVNGNGDLDYPVSLLTVDELRYAGGGNSNNRTYYLYTGTSWWSASPYYFGSYYGAVGFNAYGFIVYSNGGLGNDYYLSDSFGVRPSVSLAPGTLSMEGDGTVEDPFIVD